MSLVRLLALLSILPVQAALSPEESLRQIVADPRLEVRLWAAEPQVLDPVAIAWDETGAAFVGECRDYPYGAGPDGTTGSAVRRLVDTDGDGKADRSTVFADGLSYVTSVAPWRGGVLVVAPPEILWLRDADGDGVADQREVVLTGLRRGISDSLASGLRHGLDNRFHVANGGSSGSVRSPRIPDVVTPLGDHDFAFDPNTGRVDLTGKTGGGFGLVFDGFGRAFTPYNISHILHRFLPLDVVQRHPGFPPVSITASISDHEEMSRIYPISTALTRPNHPEQAGHFSAAGGMGHLDSGVFPADLRGSILVGDVVGNLVHRDVIHPDGPVFKASRAPDEQAREFLASRDPAFRPVAFEIGPDGALYVLDMQRDVIEHPDYIPEKVRKNLDIRAGENRGRIYRVFPKTGLASQRVASRSPGDEECLAWLGRANAWQRTTAQRLLVERRATPAVPRLRDLSRRAPLPESRVQALWTLAGLGGLRETEILDALEDFSPEVREQALQLAADRLAGSEPLRKRVVQRFWSQAQKSGLPDPSLRVRFVMAQVLGRVEEDKAAEVLARILVEDRAYRWSRLAVIASIPPGQGRRVFDQFLGTDAAKRDDLGVQEALRDLSSLLGARAGSRPEDVVWGVQKALDLAQVAARIAAWKGLVEGLERSGAEVALPEPLRLRIDERCASASPAEMDALWHLTRAFQLPENASQRAALARAIRTVVDPAQTVVERKAMLPLLALGTPGGVTNALVRLLDAREPIELQQGALAALRSFKESDLGPILMTRWRFVSPSLRMLLLEHLLERRAYHDALLSALETDQVRIGELNLDLEQRRRLLRGGSPEIRRRAAAFMGDEEYSNRKSIVAEWMAKLPAQGDAVRGRALFEESCSRCHVAGGLGHRVGPDLSGVAHRSVEDLLSNILDPNMAINPGFVAVEIETRDGESQQGLVGGESAEAVTLLQAGGTQVVIPRKEVLRMTTSGQSLMPEGLESGRTPEQLRDLIAFLQEGS
jgi:putative membrane-bound dehydrogenase-like protein